MIRSQLTEETQPVPQEVIFPLNLYVHECSQHPSLYPLESSSTIRQEEGAKERGGRKGFSLVPCDWATLLTNNMFGS